MRAGNNTLRTVSRKSPRNARIAVAVIAPISWGEMRSEDAGELTAEKPF